MESPSLHSHTHQHTAHSSAFQFDLAAASALQHPYASFPSLSPLPSPTASPLLLSIDGALSWPVAHNAALPPQQPRRNQSLPEWIRDVPWPPPMAETPQLPPFTLELGGAMSGSLYSTALPSPLPSEAVPTWTTVTASSSFTYSTAANAAAANAGAPPTMAVPALVHSAPSSLTALSPSSAFALLRTSSSLSAYSPDSPSPSSSSSSPSSHTASLSAPATLPLNPPRRRYQRLTGLSHEQRMERRRQSHRELDAVRRQREAVAINRLAELTSTGGSGTRALSSASHNHSSATMVETRTKREEDSMDVDGAEVDEKDKRHRTAVLENSVERLAELQHLVHHLAATCTQQSHDMAALRLQLQSNGLPPVAPAAIQASQAVPLLAASNVRRVVAEFGAHSLYSALFVSPSVGLLLVDCASGVALDVNERLLQSGHCSREDVVGRLVAPSYHSVTATADWDTQPTSPASAASRMHIRGQPALMYSQYGVTKEAVLALYAGQLDQIHVGWRAQLGDGNAYELPLSSFVASRDDAEGTRPRTLLVSLSMSEAKRI